MKGKKLFLLVPMVFLLVLFGWAGGARAGVAQVAAGGNHTVIVKCDGTLWAWGGNGAGQLGDGTTTDRNSAIQIGTDTDWQAVMAGSYSYTAALKKDGSLWAWGHNGYGQLGDGTRITRNRPVQIGTDKNWQAVAAGYSHTLALKKDGSLWAWGYNDFGQLGDGTRTNKNSPVQIGTDTNWQAVAGGGSYSVAVKNDGSLWAWGWNNLGKLGDGTTTDRNSPVQIGTDTNWQTVTAGYSHTLALKKDGSLWAWGDNYFSQLGDGTGISRNRPVQIGTDTDWQDIAGGSYHNIALKTNGSLWTWGGNGNGQLGDGTTTDRNSPMQIGMDFDWQAVDAGGGHTVAVKSDGSLWTFGWNYDGQLGQGTTGRGKNSPVQIGTDTNWQAVSVGDVHALALKNDGSLWAWGYNRDGYRLGDGTATNRNHPVQIGLDTDWQILTTSVIHSAALKINGSLWAWGRGQLGDGTTTDRNSPVQIGTDIDWQTVAAGYGHTLALKKDRSLWVWGYNGYGQLGDGTTISKSRPVQISTDFNWQTVAAGENHSVAVKTDGTLWSWGKNDYGQLGDGTTTNRNSPLRIGIAADWENVTAKYDRTIALKSDGSLWAWGDNSYGQLGDGTKINRNSPVQIGTDTDWQTVAVGDCHTVAVKSDGSLWAWGCNSDGQLGNGRATGNISYPVQIGTDTNWQTVAAGYAHTLALKKDGSLWAWGYNNFGELGDGTAWQDSPILIIPADSNCSLYTSYTVTPSAGNGGSISPDSPQSVEHGKTVSFEVTPIVGYSINKVEGCGGTLSGSTYTTGAITADCAVTASFVINTYTVTPSAGTGCGINPNSPQTVNHGSTASFTVTFNTGYVIDKVEGCDGTLDVSASTYTTAPVIADCPVTLTAITCQDAIIATLDKLATKASSLPISVWAAPGKQAIFGTQINNTIGLVVAQDYAEAELKLSGGSVLEKTDGCGTTPHTHDWITDCVSQAEVQLLINEAINLLQKCY